jgi:gluconokinase
VDVIRPTLIVVMGVAGSGKSTIGPLLAQALQCPFLEGDALHPQSNIEKMSRGEPLTDADRAPWLAAIRARLLDAFEHGHGIVVACSALKRSYRLALGRGLPVVWVHLRGPEELIRLRLERRAGHFMRAGLLASQMDALEAPASAIDADISLRPPDVVESILDALRRRQAAPAAEPIMDRSPDELEE